MNLNFAENIKRLRKEKRVTQEKLAEALDVSSQSVSRWELSICYPDMELLPSIANYFGVTVDSLLSNDTPSKERDREIFNQKIDTFSDDSSERIDFVREYCRKYPDDNYYAYNLVCAVRDHLLEIPQDTQKYMPLMLKHTQDLLETQYRNTVIQLMVTVCDESELAKWLDMSPYRAGFSRRACLVSRASVKGTPTEAYVQHGLEMLETMADQLDARCPDAMGAERKVKFQKDVLKTIRSFGNGDVPDGWKLFYAYKQLVLSACLFGCGEYDEGWANFDEAIEICKCIYSTNDEWLVLGSELFSGLKVSRDWNYAIDEQGNKHKLFGIVRLSFYNPVYIRDLLTNPRWAWFDSVRDTPKYKSATEWVTENEKIVKRQEI
ncbi:MAG: helix-turn-helix transcriptional regulator [Ruminococcaceae bacterium]|nr:helix-turn-helix transcriptional regulator [Oscillospiraceae bacterium]